ncbi:MAG: response regulator [Candidatus Omnitrophica bacterium]|nr:response regulator [Candidatus Omnitrophota bacterium]MDD5610674.1 response regulator [Candidatus Omnitrophota bacterium]
MKNNEINILVVDDEQVMRSLFTDLLGENGFNVTVVKNGKEAVDLIKEKFFDIAILDMHMPVMNGIETLRHVRKISPKTSIVMTDSFPDAFAEDALKEGAISCIHKPFDIRDVIQVVNEAVKKKEK